MRKLFVWEFVTLDGVMDSPMDFIAPYASEGVNAFITAQNFEAQALLLGRLTYQDLLPFWSVQTNQDFPFAEHLNAMPKYVISSTLDKGDWNNTTILKGDVIEEVTKLKASAGGAIGMIGSRRLVQTLMQADLMDEYRLMMYPVVRGHGGRLFDEGSAKQTLTLVETQALGAGVIGLSYRREGK